MAQQLSERAASIENVWTCYCGKPTIEAIPDMVNTGIFGHTYNNRSGQIPGSYGELYANDYEKQINRERGGKGLLPIESMGLPAGNGDGIPAYLAKQLVFSIRCKDEHKYKLVINLEGKATIKDIKEDELTKV